MNQENKPVYFTKDQLKQHLTARGITDNAKAQPIIEGLIARGAVIEGINETPNLAQSIAGSFIKPATDIIGTGFAGIGALGEYAGKKLTGQQTTLADAYKNQTQQVQDSGANSLVKPLTGEQIRPAQSLEQLGGDVLQTGATAIPGGVTLKGASTAAKIAGGIGYGALSGGLYGAGSEMSKDATLEDVLGGGLFGAAIGGAVGGAIPAIPSIYNAAKKTPAVVTDVFTGAKGLRSDIQTYLGKQNVAPQLETSVNRLTGTAGRIESPTALYNEYFPLAEKALTDIKVDAPISKIGSEIGDAFKSVIDNRRAVGAVMGQELKTVGKLKTNIEPIFVNFETALNEAGLTYNGLTKKMVASDLAKVAPEDIRIIEDFVGELNRIGSKPSVAQIDALISRVTDKINYAKSASGMTSTTNGERLVKATLNSLRNTFDEIPELANYAKARKTYSELSDFIDEGSGFLGKVTQSGDFAKDASLAKSAVQSILNNGKKDWLLKLEGLTDYPALDKSTLALQAMKDAGDFRGLSLLETLSDGAKTMTPSGITSRIFDWAIEKGASKVGGTPAERTRAFLQALESNNLKTTAAKNITTKVVTPASGPKTNPTTKAINKSIPNINGTIPQTKKAATKGVDKSIPKELQPLAEEARTTKIYHGTSLENANKIKKEGFKVGVGKGVSGEPSKDFVFASGNKSGASSYVNDRLGIKNPTVVEGNFTGKILEVKSKMSDTEAFGEASKMLGVPLKIGPSGKPTILDIEAIKKVMKEQGYGAIKFKDMYANGKEAYAILPENIKK